MESKLTGQTAIVTGGGRGFEREIARALAKEGVKVAVVARSADQLAETVSLIQSEGGQAIAVTADVTDLSAVARMVEQVERELGAVDILVNNAGRLTSIAPVWEADPDEWWRDVEVNIRSVFLCCHAVLKGMIQRKRGRIINFTSSGMANVSAYDCSKVAVTRFTDTLAQETKEFGISTFAIVVGPTHTEMMDYIIESEVGRKWLSYLPKELEGKRQTVRQRGRPRTGTLSSYPLEIVEQAVKMKQEHPGWGPDDGSSQIVGDKRTIQTLRCCPTVGMGGFWHAGHRGYHAPGCG